mgnify:CR=1 FL=1
MTNVIFENYCTWYFCKVKNTILILSAIILLTKPLWPVVDYIVNYDYIVNVLCENKEQPEMECNGKCYLSKELAKESTTGDENPFNNNLSNSKIPHFLILEEISEYVFSSESEIAILEETSYKTSLNPSLFVLEILHPPQFA